MFYCHTLSASSTYSFPVCEYSMTGIYAKVNELYEQSMSSVLVTSLFLNLREAAYWTRMAYDSPSNMSNSVGQWIVRQGRTTSNNLVGEESVDMGGYWRRTFRDMMGLDEFAVEMLTLEEECVESTESDGDFPDIPMWMWNPTPMVRR